MTKLTKSLAAIMLLFCAALLPGGCKFECKGDSPSEVVDEIGDEVGDAIDKAKDKK